MGRDGIEYSMTDEPRHPGVNEALYVKPDDQTIYFEALMFRPRFATIDLRTGSTPR